MGVSRASAIRPRHRATGKFVLGDVKKLLAGSSLGQAIQLTSLFVLSRIYSPADFGLLAEVQAISSVAVIVATLQLHVSIPLCKTGDEARARAKAVQSLVLTLFCAVFPLAIYLGKAFIFSAAVTLFLGLANTYSGLLIYRGSFGQLSRFYVIRAVSVVGLQFAFAFISTNDGLLWGTAVGEGITAIYLRLATFGRLSGFWIDLHLAAEVARRLKAFSLYGTLQELVSASAFYLPLVLFLYTFGDSVGGQYAMANRLVWAPVILVTSSIAQVMYRTIGGPNAEEANIRQKLILERRLVLGVLMVASLSFFLEDAFLFALGPQWDLAAKLLPFTLIWGGIFLLSTPFRVTCRVLQMQKYQLFIDICVLGGITLLFLLDLTVMQTMVGLVILALFQNATLAMTVWNALNSRLVKT